VLLARDFDAVLVDADDNGSTLQRRVSPSAYSLVADKGVAVLVISLRNDDRHAT
jgi:hypothetical protein